MTSEHEERAQAEFLDWESLLAEIAAIHVDVLKVDCEGCEFDVLPQVVKSMTRPDQIAVEIHTSTGADHWSTWFRRIGMPISAQPLLSVLVSRYTVANWETLRVPCCVEALFVKSHDPPLTHPMGQVLNGEPPSHQLEENMFSTHK